VGEEKFGKLEPVVRQGGGWCLGGAGGQEWRRELGSSAGGSSRVSKGVAADRRRWWRGEGFRVYVLFLVDDVAKRVGV
jgi:hypothetical protein